MRLVRVALSLLLLSVLALAADATLAGATTFCVSDPTCPVDGVAEPGFSQALTAAAMLAGPDRIQLGPGTYDRQAGLTDFAGSQVEIVGAGAGLTTIGAGAGLTSLDVEEPTSTVSNLTVELPDGRATTGLRLNGATARGVAVTGSAAASGTGVRLGGAATFTAGSVVLATTGVDTTGVAGDAIGAGALTDTVVSAGVGVQDVTAVARVRVFATSLAIDESPIFGGEPTLDDVLVRIAGPSGVSGIRVNAVGSSLASAITTLTARHVTVVGDGDPRSVAVRAQGFSFGMHGDASIALTDTILRDVGSSLMTSTGPPGTATIATDWSDYDAASASTAGGGTITHGTHDLADVDPGFADVAGGDFSLRADSPLVDRGDPAAPAAGESPADLLGNPRVVDGNGDGSAISDVGAFEYQPPRPPAPPSGGGSGGGSGNGSGGAASAPTLGALSLTHARFAVGRGATAKTAARRRHRKLPPRGTTIRFGLTPAATVAFTVQRVTSGLRAHGLCAKPTARLRRAHARACKRLATALTFTRHGRAGPNRAPFSGRTARGRELPPGAYRLTAVARLVGGPASKPRTTRFAIVRG
jgi:hypothetical protein